MGIEATANISQALLARLQVGKEESLPREQAFVDISVLPDELLLASIANHGKLELVTVFRRYSSIVRGIALRILKDDGEADDLLQEFFLFLFHNASIFDPARGMARSWILGMAYQMALQRRRYLKRRNFYDATELDPERHPSKHAVAENVSLQRIDGREVLRKYRDCLKAEQQQVLNLHFFEGYNFHEIAEAMGQPLQTVRSHYYRALKRLRTELVSRGTSKA